MNAKLQYSAYCKPKLAELLGALNLDLEYTSAEGNYLYTEDKRKVLDFIGGFGTAMIGHNHPELVETAISALKTGIPANAQGSIRGESAALAQRLSDLTPTEHNYYVNFSNSGAESVEAAIKHAYKVHFDKVRREYERISRVLNEFYYKIESQHLDVELPGKNDDLTDFRDDLDEYNLVQFEEFQNNPVMVAFKGSFHGKTSSALKVTFNKSYREAFEGLSSIRSVYMDTAHPERLPEIVEENVSTFYYPILEGHKVVLRPVVITRVIAFIFEIVLGEGGIRPLPEKTLDYLAGIHEELKIPFIIDEIQTGCGRLGSIYGYSRTALAGIAPEYITLSKALGGGLAKIGATLIRGDIYDHDFGILHTSTFSEDEYSSRIAHKFLDLLTDADGEIMGRTLRQGNRLLEKLRVLQDNYPSIIKDVRGAGLMIGVEFTTLQERSPFFRASGRQGVLSLLIASYLLHYHDIRLLAPLTTMLKGNPGRERLSILRIQPSATVTDGEIDSLIHALAEVMEIIKRNNEYCLMAHLTGCDLPVDLRQSPRAFPACWPVASEHRNIDARCGFVVHPTSLENLIDYYFPSFNDYAPAEEGLHLWWNSISRFLEPVHVRSSFLSSNAFVLENNMVFVPYLPDYFTGHEEPHLVREMQDKIQDAVTVAKELGDDNIPVSVVGLGAYTSIVTRNAQTINDYEMPVTTGNAYTTALTILGIMHAAELKGLDLSQAKIAVVGATGNIGMVLASILALNSGRLKLVGRQGKDNRFRLNLVRQQCWLEILRAIHDEKQRQIGMDDTRLSGLGKAVYALLEESRDATGEPFGDVQKALKEPILSDRAGRLLDKALDKTGEQWADSWIKLEMGLDHLQDCDVVIVATNCPDRDLIRPEMVKPGAVVCCASVPSNLSPRFQQNPDRNLAFDGGLAKLPENSTVEFVGMPGGQLSYGCLAETFLLGFDGRNHSFCKGMLTPEQVYQTLEMGEAHGFGLGSLKLDSLILEDIHPQTAES